MSGLKILLEHLEQRCHKFALKCSLSTKAKRCMEWRSRTGTLLKSILQEQNPRESQLFPNGKELLTNSFNF